MLLKLIVRNAMRHRLRSALTVLGMAVAILSFGLLSTVIAAWYAGVEASAADRLVTRNAISLMFRMPMAYLAKIKAVPHVKDVSYAQWFGGIYIDEKNFFPQFAVEPRSYLRLYPEYILPEKQREDFLRERGSCIAGKLTADKYGWRVGDNIILRGTIYPGQWEFTLRGIYRGARPNTDESLFFFHWDYLNERNKVLNPRRVDEIGVFIAQVDDPKRAAEVATAIDATFANSLAETLSETEKAFQLGFVSMTEAIVKAIRLVSIVVIVIILVVLANTMAMSARERTGEYAVLKTLGFGSPFLCGLIAGESVLIAAAGGALGIVLTFPAAALFGQALEMYFPVFTVSGRTLAMAGGAAILVGALAAFQPALMAMRVRIAEGLGRLG